MHSRMECKLTHMRIAFVLLCITVLSGCQWLAPETSVHRVDVNAIDAEALRAEYIALRKQTDRMEKDNKNANLELAKRDADLKTRIEINRRLRKELDASNSDLDYLESQFISLENQLTLRETRASAVATVADAQVLYARIRKDQPESISAEQWNAIDARLKSSDREMTRNNYAAATYHASRAMRLMNHSEYMRGSLLDPGSARVVSVANANFRRGPGSDFDVIGQLPYGTILTELERKGRWHRMTTTDGGTGWIHASLIR